MLDTSTGEIYDRRDPAQGRLVVDFAWLPDGVSLLFTEGGVPGSAITGIDLWRVDANGENRALVASAGTVAPVARIANLSPSPDGRSVAYAVLVPGSAGPAVDSVWVRSLASGVGFRIPLPSVASVEDIWWTDEGLVVSVVTRGTAQGRPPTQALLQVKRDGSMAALWAAPAAVDTPPEQPRSRVQPRPRRRAMRPVDSWLPARESLPHQRCSWRHGCGPGPVLPRRRPVHHPVGLQTAPDPGSRLLWTGAAAISLRRMQTSEMSLPRSRESTPPTVSRTSSLLSLSR